MSRSLASELGLRGDRAASNSRAKRQGNAFEDALDDLHELYARRGEAVVVRSPAPFRVTGHDGRGFRGVFEGAGPVDYTGLVAGRGVAFDAKSTSSSTWALDHLPAHQAEFLDAWAAQGGFGFVLLWLGGVVWVVPWSVLRSLWVAHAEGRAKGVRAAPGTASLSAAQLDSVAVRAQGVHWLPVVRRLLGAP